MFSMQKMGSLSLLLLLGAFCLTGCAQLGQRNGIILSAIDLPEEYNTPDGMVLGPDNCIYLNCPNCGDPELAQKYPPKLLKICPDDKISEVFTFEPGTGLLGVDIGRDGHFYLADNKTFGGNTNHASNLLRLVMKDGKAVRCEILVKGFIMSNAVTCHGDHVYVTETNLKNGATPMPSGVYRFSYDELNGGDPITLKPGGEDEHLIAQFTTTRDDWRGGVGANGMGFDSKGNLYVCNFGEASIIKMILGPSGKVVSQTVLAKGQGMDSTDGLKICPETDAIYVADFAGNAVHRVCSVTGHVTTIFQNANNTGGVAGLLDKPSEVCLRGNKIYVANIDLPFDGNEYDAIHNLSVLTLDD